MNRYEEVVPLILEWLKETYPERHFDPYSKWIHLGDSNFLDIYAPGDTYRDGSAAQEWEVLVTILEYGPGDEPSSTVFGRHSTVYGHHFLSFPKFFEQLKISCDRVFNIARGGLDTGLGPAV